MSNWNQMDPQKKECVVCRVIGSMVGIGAATYIAVNAPPAGIKRFAVLSFATVMGGLGFARAFGSPPFGNYRPFEGLIKSIGR